MDKEKKKEGMEISALFSSRLLDSVGAEPAYKPSLAAQWQKVKDSIDHLKTEALKLEMLMKEENKRLQPQYNETYKNRY